VISYEIGCGFDSTGSGQEQVPGPCSHGNEFSSSRLAEQLLASQGICFMELVTVI